MWGMFVSQSLKDDFHNTDPTIVLLLALGYNISF